MHVAIDGKHIGHMEITLFNDTVPKTVNNFLGLSSGSITNTITATIFYKHFIPSFENQKKCDDISMSYTYKFS